MIEFGLGFVAALVLVQLYPPVAQIGVWIVNRVKSLG